MLGESEREVTIEGVTGRLRGRLRSPEGAAWGAIVLAHGRHGTMDGPLVATLSDLPLLRALIESMTFVSLEVIDGADHRLQDAAGRTMTEAALLPTEAWVRLRKGERSA